MNDPILTNDDLLHLIDHVDAVVRAAEMYGLAPTPKTSKLRNALADAAAKGGDVYLVAEGVPSDAEVVA